MDPLAIVGFAASVLACYGLADRVGHILGVVDCPDGGRKMHARSTPLVGGIALVVPLSLVAVGEGLRRAVPYRRAVRPREAPDRGLRTRVTGSPPPVERKLENWTKSGKRSGAVETIPVTGASGPIGTAIKRGLGSRRGRSSRFPYAVSAT